MKYKRIVVKVGTNLVNREDNSLNTEFLEDIVGQIAKLHKKGHEIIFVSSGAVASGRQVLTFKKESRNIPYRQILAAVGQGILINIYNELFGTKNIKVAQALLTNQDFTNRRSFITTRNVLDTLLKMGVVPIVNENDVTTYDELKFGDNDMMSAKTATMTEAQLLVLLTDVPCVYDKDPKKHEDARCIRVIEKIDKNIKGMAHTTSSKRSLGGMATKIQAAEFAAQEGIPVIIAGGKIKDVLLKIVEEDINAGTLVKPSASRNENRKIWLKSQVRKGWQIIVDDGAKRALKEKGMSYSDIPQSTSNYGLRPKYSSAPTSGRP